ncbi:MAG TPA: DUF4157 domain-containing protein [Pyrinomonadaceae bacterium]|nr:DUF4157 domain-containing protein [Pyrinomonadaceae bacterium]
MKQEQPKAAARSSSAASVGPVASTVGLMDLQRSAGNQQLSAWLQSAPIIQTKSNDGGAADASERQADQVAEKAAQGPAASPAKSLIVDDDSKQLQPGQMRKTEFLSALRSSVSTAAEQSLKGTMWSSLGCPYIDRWFNYFNNQSGAHVERALLKYAPGAASATTARDYIPIVTERVRRGIGEWRETGQVTGLPEEFAKGGMPGATVSGLMGGLLSGIGSAVSGIVSGIGSALSSVGKMLFKRRDGEAPQPDDPQAIREQLGSGQPLDSHAKTRLQSAFGADFSNVRVHTDATAQQLSDSLNAHAFTIGTDIAFGPGEYQPGTVIGDTLIAHELAHVMQQGGSSSVQPQRRANDSDLDADADRSALGAMVSLAGGAVVPQTKPRRRSGLSLQRCDLFSSSKKPEVPPKQTEKAKETNAPAEDWDFTPEDYAQLSTGKKQLRISSDSSWFPKPFGDNLLATLSYLLGPTEGPRGTYGVNVQDFYHGHVCIKKEKLEDEGYPPTSVTDKIGTYHGVSAGAEAVLGGATGRVTQENLPAYTQAVKRSLPAAGDVLNEAVKVKNVGVVYHTMEEKEHRPADIKAGDPRRNYWTPLDTNKPEPFAPPDPDFAPSYSIGPKAPFIHVFEFGFLIDRNGEVHVRPGSLRELSTVTGKPLDSSKP